MLAIQRVVARELALIPDDSLDQRIMRPAYNAFREASLGRNPEDTRTRRDALEQAIASVRKERPSFQPRYDPKLEADANIDGL
jgi:hypothetical protein